jgi:DNA-binding transcriptional LysR family regulator
MERLLDVAPLRSFVAVADCGGFQRAAVTLHLSQGAVSQHVRRLESATGRQLMERQGRRSRFTADGELLLSHARRILAVHDEALRSFVDIDGDLVIGSTEHAAAQLLPPLAGALEQALPGYRLRFRIDRGTPLRESLAAGRIDLALLLGPGDSTCVTVGELPLNWYSAPGWVWPTDTALPLVAFDAPCVLRTRALDTLSEHGIPSVIGSEAIQVAGVQAAVRAGLGVALMATMGQTPEGLVARDDLPAPTPLVLTVWPRPGRDGPVFSRTAEALRPLLMSGFRKESA